MYQQRSIPEEVPDSRKIVPEEMPDQKELAKEEVLIIPAPEFNPTEGDNDSVEDDDKKSKGHVLEKRLEFIGLPTVVLPGKKSRKTLNSWVKKYMGKCPETWNGFLVYFDGEPVRDGKVGGYIVELSSKFGKSCFQFNDRYYEVCDYKFKKKEGIKSGFLDVLDNMSDNVQKNVKNTNKELIKAFGYKNNKR